MPPRSQVDAHVTFANGGRLEVERFLVDVSGPEASEAEAAEALVRALRLLRVESVTVTDLHVLDETPERTGGGSGDPIAGQAGAATPALVDLSHPVHAGMVTYPGLPGPEITPHLTREASRAHYAPGTEFAIDRISMVGNTGTYLDSPFHRFAGGTDLAGLPLARLADLPAVVVRTTGVTSRAVDRDSLLPFDVAGRAVLLHTGWDVHWATAQYGVDAPYLTAAGADWLVAQGAALVGIDSVNIDDTTGGTRPAHSALLAAGIPVVEHLTNLGAVPPLGATFTAVPAPVVAFGTFPVRAFARLG